MATLIKAGEDIDIYKDLVERIKEIIKPITDLLETLQDPNRLEIIAQMKLGEDFTFPEYMPWYERLIELAKIYSDEIVKFVSGIVGGYFTKKSMIGIIQIINPKFSPSWLWKIPSKELKLILFLKEFRSEIFESIKAVPGDIKNFVKGIGALIRKYASDIFFGIGLAWQSFTSGALGLLSTWTLMLRPALYNMFMSIVNGVTALMRGLFIKIGNVLKTKITSAFLLKSLAAAAKLAATIVGAAAGLAILAGVTISHGETSAT